MSPRSSVNTALGALYQVPLKRRRVLGGRAGYTGKTTGKVPV